jgi:hypothetical protein
MGDIAVHKDVLFYRNPSKNEIVVFKKRIAIRLWLPVSKKLLRMIKCTYTSYCMHYLS